MAVNNNESWAEGLVCLGFFQFYEFLHLNQPIVFIHFVHMAKSQLRVITVSFIHPARFLKTLRTTGAVRLDICCFVTGAERV